MNILFDINHPADVHQFKNLIRELEKKNNVLVIARNKECTQYLLRKEKIKFIPRKGYYGIIGKLLGMLIIDSFLIKQSIKFKPDLLIGSSGDCYIAQTSKLIGKPSIIFDDTEHSKFQNLLTFPFATKIVTPECYTLNLGKKQIRYNGFKELAYLKGFKPKKNILKKYNLIGKFSVIRLVSWDANHDIGIKGIEISKLVGKLEKKGKILISSEAKLPRKYHKYLIKDPDDLHSLLYHADLFIGEGASTATEAALLGTPTIYTNKLNLGYIDELKRRNLLYQITDEDKAIKKATELLDTVKKRKPLLSNMIDVNKFMYNLITK